ncbi:MAG: PilZ domain-containing protein [Desulfobulbaceae bacterium]|nr:PilZ domain-containing protein [Desulfobulbaceae bacterium]
MRRERRAFARIQLELPASLYLFEAEMNHSGSILDLSLGGCYFPFDGTLTIGEKCKLKLTVGEGLKTETMYFTGVIARTDKNGVGIQFTDTSPADQERLGTILSIY